MRYIVTADRPTQDNGRPAKFRKGDVIEIPAGASSDFDGDYLATRASDALSGYIHRGDIRLATATAAMLDSRAVRAALAVCGLNDEAARKVLETAEKIAGVL